MTTRIRLTKHQQLTLCHKYDERSDWTLNDLARWAAQEFSLPKCPGTSSIQRILQTKKQLSSLSADCLSRKELRSPFLLQLDQAIAEFVVNAELAKMPISGAVVLAMARRVADKLQMPAAYRPLFTRAGWLRHFLARYGFRRKRAHGEISSVDVVAARRQLQRLREQVGQFHPSDMYNMDETVLFFRSTLRTSIALHEAPGRKQDKSRVTMVVAANADGSGKLPLVFLGKAATPRWLHDKPDSVQYGGTSKGWMTAVVYQEWLQRLNAKMKEADRHILLLVDNAPVHIDRDLQLSNMKVQKLPPNTTALLQPMDRGVIACLKLSYATLRTEAAVDRYLDGTEDPYKVSLLEGTEWCAESWSSISVACTQNCWRHSGLLVDRAQISSILN